MPLQPGATQSLPGNKARKTGPGTKRTPGAVVGPTEQPEPINVAAQTNRAAGHTLSGSGLGDNPKTIARDLVTQAANYGTT